MHFANKACQTASRLNLHRLVWVVALVASSLGLNSSVQAAGCAHRTENASVGLDPFGNPLASNVLKVYSGGEFHYYVLPEGKPCNGPNCKGAPPINIASVPQVIGTERCDLTFLSNGESVATLLYCNQFVCWPSCKPDTPMLDGLLRPPTV